MSSPGGETSEVTLEKAGLGVWRTSIDVKVPGLYKMQSNSPTGQLTAVAHAGLEDAREMSEVTATEDKMKPLVEATGGGVFWTRGRADCCPAYRHRRSRCRACPCLPMRACCRARAGWACRDREAFVTRGVKLTPMFTGLLALAALLFFITLAWWREGR